MAWTANKDKVFKEAGLAVIRVSYTQGTERIEKDYRMAGSQTMGVDLDQLIKNDLDALNQAYVFADSVILGPPTITSEFVVQPATLKTTVQANIPVVLFNRIGSISGFQFDVVLPSGFTLGSALLGKSATSAGKSISTNANRVLVFGVNQNIIDNGEVVLLPITADVSVLPGNYTISFINGASTNPAGNNVTALYTGGKMAIP